MAFPSYTYTFANATTADATQVNQNFTDILNGISDATKDISVNALTAAGAATLNGNVTLGNGSAKTITFSGSLSSSIPVGANTTYDFGSATLGLRSVYVGGTSTFTTRIMSAATASWTLNLPVTAGTSGQFMQTDGSGNASWANAGGATCSVTSKTTTYAAANTDDIILCSGSAFTVTLFTAVGNTGKRIMIKKTDSSLTNQITIATTSSQTIEGKASGVIKLMTQYEEFTFVSDGTNWQILDHFASTGWNDGGAVAITGTTTNPTKGTMGVDKFYWRRQGCEMHFRINMNETVSGGNNGTGDYLLATPDTTNILIDTTVLVASATVKGGTNLQGVDAVGNGSMQNGTAFNNCIVYVGDSTHLKVYVPGQGVWSAAVYGFTNTNVAFYAIGSVPITGWQP